MSVLEGERVPRRIDHKVVIVITLIALGLGALALDRPATRADTAPLDPTNPATPVTVTADGLPTVQINGVVWTQEIIGNTVFAGGRFTSARPAGSPLGTNETPRANFLAYDIRTGNLITSFAPSFNAQVRAVAKSDDGTQLYVGGDFTTVNGQPRLGLAAIDATSGALLDWAPSATGGAVYALVVSPDKTKVAVGGRFTALNGGNNPGYGLGALDSVTATSLPWKVNATVRSASGPSGITSLSSDGINVFGTGFVYGGGGNFEGTFSARWSDGQITWLADCHGDTYSAWSDTKVVYTVSHNHYCGNLGGFPQGSSWRWYRIVAYSAAATRTLTTETVGYTNFAGNPAPTQLGWTPETDVGTFTGQYQGPWHVTGNADYVVMGGEFRNVNFVGQQGLVRFARSGIAPNKQAAVLWGKGWNIRAVSSTPGTVRITWPANWDRDNENLRYRLYRNNRVIYDTVSSGPWWQLPTLGFTDTGLTPGSQQWYWVTATDASGTEVPSQVISVTVRADGSQPYQLAALESAPRGYWRIGDLTGADSSGSEPMFFSGSPTLVPGAITGDTDQALQFDRTKSTIGYTKTVLYPIDSISVGAWIKTGSKVGGHIIGYGSSASTALSGTVDRMLYMRDDGRVNFGLLRRSVVCSPGCTTVDRVTVSSPTALNDDKWHFVVGTIGGGTMRLYVDGVQVATLPNIAGSGQFNGAWRIGGDSLANWANRPTSDYFTGTIDEPMWWTQAATPESIARMYTVGTTGRLPNGAPTAAFTATPSFLTVALDASASTDPENEPLTYSWSMGDGKTVTGVSGSYTYDTAGTYTVTLTVTDPQGATGTLSRQVTVIAPPVNQPPVAQFNTTVSDLRADVDGRSSSDPDGTVTSWAWEFGDGSTATGPTASNTYASPGTYTVRLTVVDDKGAATTTTQSVTVTAPPPGPVKLAGDAFGRTIASGGWGVADLGGSWRTAGDPSSFSVVGGVARMTLGAPAAGAEAYLDDVSTTDADVSFTMAFDKAAAGGSNFLTLHGRRVGTSSYTALVRQLTSGDVQLVVSRNVGGSETNLGNVVVPDLKLAGNEPLKVRVQVTGTSPTTIRVKVWKAADAEPAAWQLTLGDAAPSLQAPGSIALIGYLSRSSSVAPLTILLDDLQVWSGR